MPRYVHRARTKPTDNADAVAADCDGDDNGSNSDGGGSVGSSKLSLLCSSCQILIIFMVL